jgi:rhodanese-related sulfurtransferase
MVVAPKIFDLRWSASLTRDTHDAPLIPPLFVAEQGPGVEIADIRSPEDATGVLGYIPGGSFPGVERLRQLARETAITSPLVIVCATGDASAKVARQLEELGVKHVAAMAGGLAGWRSVGLCTSRDPTGVRDVIHHSADPGAGSGPLKLERVREHIGDPRSVRWINLASMIAHGRLSCIDGRDERGVVGAPGGDGGEFLLTLAAIERATGRRLDEETATRGLLSRLDTFGDFYMHTDLHAFDALTGALQADSRVQSAVAGCTCPEEWIEFLRNPPPELRETLLEHLLDPAHIGCGHIRLMLQKSDEYGIRRELVLSFLCAFYRLWWGGSPELGLTVLPGDHEEGAVVNVRLAEEVWDLSRVPLISPACGGQQMFVNHPDVSSFLRRRTVQSFVREAGPLTVEPSREGTLQRAVDELAARQLGATVGYLAQGLPVFEVVFAKDGSFDVGGVSA